MLDSRTVYKGRVDAALMYIHEHMGEELDLGQLASVGGFSPYHFLRIFSAVVGETPQQFIIRVRLERAANLLVKRTEDSITQIAIHCGFSSSAAFARSFKKRFGISANEYRQAVIKPMAPGVFPAKLDLEALPQIKPEIRNLPALNLLTISSLNGYRMELICKAWNQLYGWASARDLITPNSLMLGISLDDPLITAPEKCRYYACISIDQMIEPQTPVGFMRVEAAKYVVARVTCTGEQIQGVYMYLYRHWLLDSGYQPADLPPFEVYLDTPEHHPEGKFLIDVYIPIVPL
jgi:AraC family transcriptional regulator